MKAERALPFGWNGGVWRSLCISARENNKISEFCASNENEMKHHGVTKSTTNSTHTFPLSKLPDTPCQGCHASVQCHHIFSSIHNSMDNV